MASSGDLSKKLIDPTDLSYTGGGSVQSANIVQAALAQHVGGGNQCMVLSFCKEAMHTNPAITQLLLRNLEGIREDSVKSMQMGNTDCFLHLFGLKGAFAVCLTKGNNSPQATYGFLNAIIRDFYTGTLGNQGQFANVNEASGALASNGMKAMMNKWNGPNVLKTEKLNDDVKKTIAHLGSVIDSLNVRGDKLDELLSSSEDLAEAAQEVLDAGKAVYCKMLWRFWKWILMIVIALLCLIAFICIGVCSSGTKC